MNDIKELLEDHAKEDSNNFERIYNELKVIRENHLHHIEGTVNRIENDMDWIKRFFWLVASISVTAIGGAMFGLIIK